MPFCFICTSELHGINQLHRHLRLIHKLNDNCSVFKCAEVGCYQRCSNWTSYRRHLNKFHYVPINNTSDSVNDENISEKEFNSSNILPSDELKNDEYRNNNFSSCTDDSTQETDSHDECPVNETFLKDQIRNCTSMLIAKLYSEPGRPRKMIQEYVENITHFLSISLSLLSADISAILQRQNVDSDIIHEICCKFNVLKNPFEDLSSEYLRLQYLKKFEFYIAPEVYNIAPDMFTKKIHRTVLVEIENAKGQFVPLRKILKVFLELPNVFNIVKSVLNKTSCGDFFADYIHGSHWQKKKILFGEKLVIPLFVFYDDFEVDKEIGSHSAKLGAVYVKIACLPSEFQSSLDNIFLALLFNTTDRINYGNTRTFKIFIKELNFLFNNGIEIIINDVAHRVYFVMALLVADNLALHSMLGFAEGFAANFPCRICHAHKSLIHFQTEEDSSLLRNKLQYDIDCKIGNVSLTGVNEESVLNEIETFEATDNPSVDIMHDVFEGVCVYDMGHILYHLIFVKNYFTVETLNFRLITFDYDKTITNKPTEFNEKALRKKSVKMTASEMRTFVRIFAILVGDLIPDNDPVWKFYLILRDIIDILLCRQMQKEIVKIFKKKITEHHHLYVFLFHDTLKPKHHHMIHYPSIVPQSGVLINLACDRFEANHQPAVQDAKATNSRKNIAYTLALKQQLRCAYRFMARKGLHTELEVGPEENLDYYNLSFPPVSFSTDFTQHAFVIFKGTLYKKGMCIAIGVDDDNGPEFGIISSVLVNHNGSVCLVCNVLLCITYNEHFHAYNVTNTAKIISILVIDLLDYLPLLFCKGSDGKQYVTLHHLL